MKQEYTLYCAYVFITDTSLAMSPDLKKKFEPISSVKAYSSGQLEEYKFEDEMEDSTNGVH